jgi:PKHD-type hydroxylase
MANLAQWFVTDIPKEMTEIIYNDLKKYDSETHESEIMGAQVDKVIRNSKTFWIPTSHWLGGFIWYYVSKANRENFLYDIEEIDGGSIQYTQYEEGQFYNWHIDAGLDTCYKPQIVSFGGYTSQGFILPDKTVVDNEKVRKLSFSLQLSEPTEYTGGEVQFLDNSGKTFFAPKQRGTLIIFDSRTHHRVRKVKSGLRKSLVGWAVGNRWK